MPPRRFTAATLTSAARRWRKRPRRCRRCRDPTLPAGYQRGMRGGFFSRSRARSLAPKAAAKLPSGGGCSPPSTEGSEDTIVLGIGTTAAGGADLP